VTEQRIRQAVPGLPVGNLTVEVLKSQLQMYGGAMFVLDDKTRHKSPNEHIFNKGVIKRDELLDACRQFMDKPGDQGGVGAPCTDARNGVALRVAFRQSAPPRSGRACPSRSRRPRLPTTRRAPMSECP
jgi:hypothetical protein